MGTSSKDTGFSVRRAAFEWSVGCPDGLVREVCGCGVLGVKHLTELQLWD